MFYGESVALDIYEKGRLLKSVDLHPYISVNIKGLGKIMCDENGVKDLDVEKVREFVYNNEPDIDITFTTDHLPNLEENLIKHGEIADVHSEGSIIKMRYGIDMFDGDGGYNIPHF